MELQELHWLATFREDRFSGGIGAVHIEPLKKKGVEPLSYAKKCGAHLNSDERPYT
jgi:hypothetical protein